jgi:hypothetical protein
MEVSLPLLSPLSASKIKTLENCSWLYWCNYHLKLPQGKNDGARKGDVCHKTFEVLLNKRHFHHFNKIVNADSVNGSQSVARLVRKLIKKSGLKSDIDTFVQIDQMILVGLKCDFFIEGGTLVAPEFKFDYTEPRTVPRFRIKGFMDKPFIKGDELIIDDYKSSKKKFEGEDNDSNIQALFYSYIGTKLWPNLTPRVRFIFLQFPNDPISEVKFTRDALKGFEYFLIDAQQRVNKFSEKDAKTHLAAEDPRPKDGEFKGPLLCGFANHPGKLKKDGTKMFHCPYRFPFDYNIIKKKDGTISKCAFWDTEVILKDGETIEKAHYSGCPAHNKVNVLDTFPATQINKSTTTSRKYANVLDDF